MRTFPYIPPGENRVRFFMTPDSSEEHRDVREQLNALTLQAALNGNLWAVMACYDDIDGIRTLTRVVRRAESWPARIRAAELLRTWSSCTVFPDEHIAYAVHALRQAASESKGVALTVEDHAEVLSWDLRGHWLSWIPRCGFPAWFSDIANDIEKYHNWDDE